MDKIAICLLLTIVLAAKSAPPSKAVKPPKETSPLGTLYLNEGDFDAARSTCEAALKTDPNNDAALRCVQAAIAGQSSRAEALQSRALDQALALVRSEKTSDAIQAVNAIPGPFRTPSLEKRAGAILELATRRSVPQKIKQFLSDSGIAWVIDVVVGGLLIVGVYWLLKLARFARRFQKELSAPAVSIKKQWRLMPIQDDDTKLGTSALVLSAYQSLSNRLQDSYSPILLFGPTRNSGQPSVLTFESTGQIAALQSQITVKARQSLVARVLRHDQATAKPEGFLALKQQQFEFSDALRELNVKVGGVDLPSLGRFFAAVGQWFNAGVPTITGRAFIDANADPKSVVVMLTCADPGRYATVSAKGTDISVKSANQAANSAVYKMLYLLGHENAEVEDADAAGALRDAIQGLREYLNGDRQVDDDLKCIYETISKARRSLTGAAPQYLRDRALLWEAAAEFALGQPDNLTKALRHLELLRDSPSRQGLQVDVYNEAVVHQVLGNFAEARGLYGRLTDRGETWATWILYGKAAFLSDPRFQLSWSRFADDVRTWKEQLYKMQTSESAPPDGLAREIDRHRPTNLMVWRAILDAELDCPMPSRPITPTQERLNILKSVRAFFERHREQNPTIAPEDSLRFARAALYLQDWKTAQDASEEALKGIADHSTRIYVVTVYVRAEAEYSDQAKDPVGRAIEAFRWVQPLETYDYPPLSELVSTLRPKAATVSAPGGSGTVPST